MADLSDNNPITADGTYDLTVIPGKPYLFTLKGSFGSGTVAMSISTSVPGQPDFDDVIDGSWTDEHEDTVIPSGKTIRLTVSGSTTPEIRVTFIPTAG